MKEDDKPFVEGIRQGRRPNKAKIDLAAAFGEKPVKSTYNKDTASEEAVVVCEPVDDQVVTPKKERKPRGKMTSKDKMLRAKRKREAAKAEKSEQFANHSERMKAYWAAKRAEKADAPAPTPEEKEKAIKRRYNPESLKNLRGVQGNQKGDGQSPATKAMHQDLKDVWQWMQGGNKTSLRAQAKKDPRWFYELVKGCFPKDVFVQQMVDTSKMSEQQLNEEIVKLLKANGVGVPETDEKENTYNKDTESEGIDKKICELMAQGQGEVKH